MKLEAFEIEELCQAAQAHYRRPAGVRVPVDRQQEPAEPGVPMSKAWGRPVVRRLRGRSAILLELKDAGGPIFVLARDTAQPVPALLVRFLIGAAVAAIAPPVRPIVAPAMLAGAARARGRLLVVELEEAMGLTEG